MWFMIRIVSYRSVAGAEAVAVLSIRCSYIPLSSNQ